MCGNYVNIFIYYRLWYVLFCILYYFYSITISRSINIEMFCFKRKLQLLSFFRSSNRFGHRLERNCFFYPNLTVHKYLTTVFVLSYILLRYTIIYLIFIRVRRLIFGFNTYDFLLYKIIDILQFFVFLIRFKTTFSLILVEYSLYYRKARSWLKLVAKMDFVIRTILQNTIPY